MATSGWQSRILILLPEHLRSFSHVRCSSPLRCQPREWPPYYPSPRAAFAKISLDATPADQIFFQPRVTLDLMNTVSIGSHSHTFVYAPYDLHYSLPVGVALSEARLNTANALDSVSAICLSILHGQLYVPFVMQAGSTTTQIT